jgi:hypothetical protein
MTTLENLICWALGHGEGSTVGLVLSFAAIIAITVLGCLWLMLTTNRFWHQRFHVGTGVRLFCDHCIAAHSRGYW